MILRLLNIQGIAGLAVSLALFGLLLVQKVETRHWRKQSDQFEQLYRGEQAAFAGTVANYRAAAEAARTADLGAAERVRNEQSDISERTAHDYEARLAAARARVGRLRVETEATATDPGVRAAANMPRLPTASRQVDPAAAQEGLPLDDALTATEQAIQLDELIMWVRAQAKVDNSGRGRASETRSDR